MLVPYNGKNVPVTVEFSSDGDGRSFRLDRVFHFAGRKPVRFCSSMEHIGGNVLVEFMRFGVGWKLACRWDGSKIVLEHRGFVWRLFGRIIPVPLALAVGRDYAEEEAVDDHHFSMSTHSKHPIWGEVFAYSGRFRIEEVTCDQF